MRMSGLRLRTVFTYSPAEQKTRLFRLIWERGNVGDGNGYSAKLSFSVRPRLWECTLPRKCDWDITVCGLRVYYTRAYGGKFS